MPASISKDTIDASSTTTSPMQFHETASRKFASGLFPSAPWTVRASIPVRSVRLRAALPVGAATTYGTKASLRSLKQCTMASMSVVLPQPAPPRIMERLLFSASSIASRCCSLRRMSPARSSLGISMTGKAGALRMSASRSAAVTSYAEIQMLVL